MPAVISRAVGECTIESLTLRPLGRRDIRVRIDASGICHSDVSLCDGSLGGELPAVLGHEGAGTVVETGSDVTMARCGDRVVLAAVAPCGLCWTCVRGQPYLCAEVRRTGGPAFVDTEGSAIRGASGLGTLTDELVVDERVAIVVETELPAEQLAMIGCAVLTGAGAVLNIAHARPGERVLVVGVGGIGLAAVMMAAATGVESVVAVDTSPAARAAGRAVGASAVLDPADPASSEALADLSEGRGFDIVLDCVGHADTFSLAWHATRRAGHLVLIGVAPASVRVPLSLSEVVLTGKRISGCIYGASAVHRDVPMYVRLAENGRFPLAGLLGSVIDLDSCPAVVLAGGRGPGRTVVVNSSG